MVGIQYFCLILAVLFFYKGKAIRGWTARFGPMKNIDVEI